MTKKIIPPRDKVLKIPIKSKNKNNLIFIAEFNKEMITILINIIRRAELLGFSATPALLVARNEKDAGKRLMLDMQ